MLTLIAAAALLPPQEPAKLTGSNALDFWAGQWTLDSTTPLPDKPDQVQKDFGVNTITKELKGNVIHESFKSAAFSGQSWSVFDPKSQKWHQTWVDDQGGYLTFQGGLSGDEFVLNQIHPAPTMRMRFTEIKKTSFVWLWESRTTDGWALKWRIDYRRKS